MNVLVNFIKGCPVLWSWLGLGQWEPWRRPEEGRASCLWPPPGCDRLAMPSEGHSLRLASSVFSLPRVLETHPASTLQEFAPVSSCPVGFSADTLLRSLLNKFFSSSSI